MTKTLLGRIVENYRTIRAFAAALGMNEQKVRRIVGGAQEPTASEILAMARLLHVEIPEDMRNLFFADCPQKV